MARTPEHMDISLHAFLDAFLGRVVLLDDQGHIAAVNQKWSDFVARNTAYRCEEWIGSDYIQLCRHYEGFNEETADRIRATIQTVLRGQQQSDELEYQALAFVEPRWFHVSIRTIRHHQDTWVVISHLDITERKQAEEALRGSEERFHRFSDAAFEAIVIHRDGVPISANRQYYEMFGYEPEELIGRQGLPLTIAPEELEHVRNELATGGLRPYETVGLRKDGTRFPIEIRIREWKHEGQKVRVAAIMDITERKRTESSLRESEDKFKVLSEQSLLAIGLVQDGVFKYVNQAHCEMTGYSHDEIMNWTPYEFAKIIHPDDREFVMEQGRKTEAGLPPQVEHYQFRGITKNGDTKWLDMYSRTVPYQGKHANLFMHVDITERKRAEEALRQSEENFRAIASLSPASIAILGVDEHDAPRFLYVNAACERMTGYSRDEMMCLSPQDITHPAMRTRVAKNAAARLRGEDRPSRYENRIITKSGETRWWDFAATKIQYQGTPAILTMAFDITERKRAEEALLTSQAQLREALKIAKLCYWEYDVTERMFTFNDQFYHVYRTSVERVGGYRMSPERYVQLFFHPGDEPVFDTLMQRVTDEQMMGHDVKSEHRVLFGDGQTGYVSVHFFAIYDKDGHIVKTFGANQDITERKRAEEALQERTILLQEAERIARFGSWSMDLKTNRIIASDVMLDIYQYREDPEDLDVESWLPYVHPEDRDRVLTALQESASGLKPYNIEFRIIRGDGQERILWAQGELLRDESGQPVKMFGTGLDITDRKKAEEALKASEERFDLAMNATRDGLFDWHLPTHAIYYSPGLKKMLGYEDHELPHDWPSWAALIDPKYVDHLLTMYREMIDKQRDQFKMEFRIRHREGRWVDVLCRAKAIFDERDRATRIVGTCVDISEPKALEQQLLDHQQQLKSLTSDLILAEERLKNTFATQLHDNLCQSLVMLRLRVGMLTQSLQGPTAQTGLNKIYDTIGDIIDETRNLTTGLSYPELHLFGFEEAVSRWSSEEFQLRHHIPVFIQNDGQDKPLGEDTRIALFRGFRELLTNVVKHAEASRVDIDIARRESSIVIQIMDDGKGVDSNRQNTSGFGLLSIRETLARLGGQLQFESEADHGCKVTMVAPLATA